MDDIVRQAMAKWPHVPACYGWLGLDARGDWYLRDAACQAAGSFPHPRGSRLEHRSLVEFIARNYQAAADGCWFFQNGPQRVFVELEAAPLALRVAPGGAVQAHTGRTAQVASTWLDERGRLYALTDIGYGIVHSQDVLHAADAIEAGAWPAPATLAFAAMPERFDYVISPAAAHAGDAAGAGGTP